MKVKDIERTANVAWSPKNHHPLYLAAGTAAQQLDASFNTSAALEVYALNLSEPGPDTQLVSAVPSEHRFHKIIWGHSGTDSAGILIGGCDDGLLQIYNASKLIKGENALVGKQQKHAGPVHALDFNSFQQNLFASGAGESEIFIWDLNNTSTPMSPGTKSQPSEDVLSVAWNKQVQHILASSFASKCVIWDLRKNEPIIKLTDNISRIRWKMVAWHPEVATQLCLASEEDHSPIIQLWDLRYATSPLKTLENHQRGVLAVSWCSADADLLISCGKDDRILCWNPNSNHTQGEVLSEIAKMNQWSFDIAWCPRNPALIASPNYDGHVYVYSVMGGKTKHIQTSNKIADSFPGMEGYAQAPEMQQTTVQESVDPSKAPKWLRRPVGASFGFGGKLISFEEDKENAQVNQQQSQPGQAPPHIRRTVQISQVVTEPDLVKKSSQLEEALDCGNFVEYCLDKSESTTDQHKKYIWHFLKANFEQNPRAEILNLLGYRIEDVNSKLSQHIGKPLLHSDVENLTDQFDNINRIDDFESRDPFNAISQQNGAKKSLDSFKIKTGDDTEGLITQALLLNNVEAAVELCLKAERYADALVIATTGGPELLAKTQHRYLEISEGYVANLISAIVSEDWSSIINHCDISSWKEALAAILTHASEDDLPILCEQLGTRLENESHSNSKYSEDAQLCYICSGSFERLVCSWSDSDLESTTKLQELVELMSFLQKAIERQGKRVQISGALADLLSRYASLLASQGDLSTALSYLGSSQNEKVSSLRDRLLTAIGQKPQNIQEIRHQQANNRRSSTRTSFSSYGGTANMFQPTSQSSMNQFPPVQAPPPSVPPPASAHFGQSFNTGLPNPTAGNQPWQAQPAPSIPSYSQPPKPFSPTPQAPPLTQPPRPVSGGSAQGGLPKPKYVLDPSVTSNNAYTNHTPLAPLSNQPVPSFDSNVSSYGGNPSYNSPVPSQFNQQQTQMYQPPPFGGSIPNAGPTPRPLVPSQVPPVESAQSAVNYQAAQAPPGWNDPPMVSRSTRTQPPKSDLINSEPITHPIFGTAPAPSHPTPNANGYGYGEPAPPPPMQPYNPGMPPPSTPYQQQHSMYNPQNIVPSNLPPSNAGYNNSVGFSPNAFNQNATMSDGQRPMQSQQQRQEVTKPPTPVQKPPVPDEYSTMQKVFEELRNRCSCAANNPQTRRKLDDVARKLETLYDCLRYNQLSPNALSSLHQMVQYVENGDYTNGLQLHTQMVQSPDFSQIASFMPGLKVLLQCALQLHVYLN